MARKKTRGLKQHDFRNKLLLNQWLISLFGIDPLADNKLHGQSVRPFRMLSESIREPRLEGLDQDNVHHFYHALVDSHLFWDELSIISKEQILNYETNIVSHTQAINEGRYRPVVWKYFQWLSLLFTEIYLDRFFSSSEQLTIDLNKYVDRFNQHWSSYADVPHYTEDDLNKICLQSATGSGKTLLMHVNLLQYHHYAQQYGRVNDLSHVILLTPNERLSEQHIFEFRESNISAASQLDPRSMTMGLSHVNVTEITKLGEQEGPQTVETRSLGDNNLLLVDEGHRGMSGKEEGVWLTRRSQLCARGFTFEYSATFEQAVAAAKRTDFENSYAKSVIFDYSYRWFYEDGFGKDYQILNLPESYDETKTIYLTACLLKFYQQQRIFEEKPFEFTPFNLEKPLWVFVGNTVSAAKGRRDEKIAATDVAQIIQFISDFLEDRATSCRRIGELLSGKGQDTGLLDKDGNDIFDSAFTYLAKGLAAGANMEDLYSDILGRLFNNPAGGVLSLERIKGDTGEIVLRVGTAETPFGLINVGDAKGLCDHIVEVASHFGSRLEVRDSDFTETQFNSVRDSSSPINLLIGSKKFVEGWDCWRVSTMGLMHVGRTEGTQIIQLFGRGVRLKGYKWSLKRSGHAGVQTTPPFIYELETLNVFGIQADFMERFREFLRDEGLPGNERKQVFNIPLNVTYDFGKKLKILRPKRKVSDGSEYDFKKDGPVPSLGEVPAYFQKNRVVVDWYPRIQAIRSRGVAVEVKKEENSLNEKNLAFLDYDALYFEVEKFKRERSWHNLNINKNEIKPLLQDNTWYTLEIPRSRLEPSDFRGVLLLQQVAAALLKRYCERYYNYCKRAYLEPRLEYRELTRNDELLPEDDQYRLIVDGDELQIIQDIKRIQRDLAANKECLLEIGDIKACNFDKHLYQPLFHVRGGKIRILPVALNESEYQFVKDLKKWCDKNNSRLTDESIAIFLLRNMSRGKGIGFFEAGNFHPDFILWVLSGDKQYILFIDPHGLRHEGPGSEKILFHERIKDVEKRLADPSVVLHSFILSWTRQPELKWGYNREELEDKHVLFMTDDRDRYIDKLFRRALEY